MKITGTLEEFDVVLRALLKYSELLQKANSDGVVKDVIVIADNWLKENTVKQLNEIFYKVYFEEEK